MSVERWASRTSPVSGLAVQFRSLVSRRLMNQIPETVSTQRVSASCRTGRSCDRSGCGRFAITLHLSAYASMQGPCRKCKARGASIGWTRHLKLQIKPTASPQNSHCYIILRRLSFLHVNSSLLPYFTTLCLSLSYRYLPYGIASSNGIETIECLSAQLRTRSQDVTRIYQYLFSWTSSSRFSPARAIRPTRREMNP